MQILLLLTLALIYLSNSIHLSHDNSLSHTTTIQNFKCCPETYVLDEDTLTCVCPQQTPLIDVNGRCISCLPPLYFDNNTKLCNQCSDIKVFNSTLKACVCPYKFYNDETDHCYPCLEPFYWNQSNSNCLKCPEGFQMDPKTSKCECPHGNPYLSLNNTCISCETGFDKEVFDCVRCLNQIDFHSLLTVTKNISIQYTFEMRLPNTKLMNFICFTIKNASKLIEKVSFNIAKLFLKQLKKAPLLRCPKPKYWNAATLKCLSCPTGFQIDQQTLKCECYKQKPYLTSNNTCISCNTIYDQQKQSCIECTNGQIWNEDIKKCVCPQQKSFQALNGTCVACPKPDYWDNKDSKCLRCPIGFQIDPKTLKCDCPQQKPYLLANKTCASCDAPNIWKEQTFQCQSPTTI